jgi:hypothetical protein
MRPPMKSQSICLSEKFALLTNDKTHAALHTQAMRQKPLRRSPPAV